MNRTTPILLLSLLLGCDTGVSDTGIGGDTGHDDGGQEGEELIGDDTATTTTTTTALSSSATGLSFGPKTTVGCVGEVSVTVTNTSSTTADIVGLAFSSAPKEFSLQLNTSLPLALKPGSSFDFLARYTPLDENLDAGSLDLYIGEDTEPSLAWAAEGNGRLYGHGDETFSADGASSLFALSTNAVAETVIVQLDGAALPDSEWSLTPEGDHISFTTVPAPGAEIQIDYAILPPECG
ncbi:MAG: hypothetical protein ACI8RZ_007080 [Myxococcota bacterium]|jgi:hypothetical protein